MLGKEWKKWKSFKKTAYKDSENWRLEHLSTLKERKIENRKFLKIIPNDDEKSNNQRRRRRKYLLEKIPLWIITRRKDGKRLLMKRMEMGKMLTSKFAVLKNIFGKKDKGDY